MACSWTQEQLTALEAAIAQGIREVYYGDKRVVYRSLDEMLRLRRQMQECLGIIKSTSTKVFAKHNKGFYPDGDC